MTTWFEVHKRGKQVGQSSSQRKAQHQGVELWELYEEDGKNSDRARRRQGGDRNGRDGRDRNADRVNRSRQGSSSDRRVRESGREVERIGSTGRGSLDVVNVTRDAADRNITNQRTGRRRTDSIGSGRSRAVRVSGQEDSRVGRSRPAGAGQGGRGQQTERPARARSTGSARPVQSIRRRRARRRKEFYGRAGVVLLMAICLVMIYLITGQIYQMTHRKSKDKIEKTVPVVAEKTFQEESKIGPPDMIEDLLEINEYSRPGTPLSKVNSIFVHYTANPGTSAAQNRSYFANLAETHERSASAHLIIGYDGELIQCIPFDEQAYAVMTRNEDSISIECCYLSEDGAFTQETYDTLVHTLAWLLEQYDLSTEDILRHYDCGGKLCPLYYAENEGAWKELRQDVAAYMAAAK